MRVETIFACRTAAEFVVVQAIILIVNVVEDALGEAEFLPIFPRFLSYCYEDPRPSSIVCLVASSNSSNHLSIQFTMSLQSQVLLISPCRLPEIEQPLRHAGVSDHRYLLLQPRAGV